MGFVKTSFFAIALPLIPAGCVNSPGALTMSVAPEKEVFAVGEPIRLNVALAAMEGPICIGGGPHFTVNLEHVNGEESRHSAPQYACGTRLMAGLPLWVVLFPAALLDVTDLSARYRVLQKDVDLRLTLEVVERHSGTLWVYVYESGSEDIGLGEGTGTSLVPGTYRAQISLSPPGDILPAPLFWKTYDQAVVAETKFAIESGKPESELTKRVSSNILHADK